MPGIFHFGRSDNYTAANLSAGPHTDQAIQIHLQKLRDHLADLKKALEAAEKTGKPQWVARFDTNGDIGGQQSAAQIENQITNLTAGIEGLRFLQSSHLRNAFETIRNKLFAAQKGRPAPVDKAWVEATLMLSHNVLSDIRYHAWSDQESYAALKSQGFGYLFRPSSVPGHLTFTYKSPSGEIGNLRIPYQVNENGIVLDDNQMTRVSEAIANIHIELDNTGIPRKKAIIDADQKPSLAPPMDSTTKQLWDALNLKTPIPQTAPKPSTQPVPFYQDPLYTGADPVLMEIKSITTKGQNADQVVYNNRQVLMAEKPPQTLDTLSNVHLSNFIYDNKKGFEALQKELIKLVKLEPTYQEKLRTLMHAGKSNPLIQLLSVDQKTGKLSVKPTNAMKDLCKLLKIDIKTVHKPTAPQPDHTTRPPSPSRLRRS